MSITRKLLMEKEGVQSMQLAWHYLVNSSFAYLGLLATVRLAQELSAMVPTVGKAEKRLS